MRVLSRRTSSLGAALALLALALVTACGGDGDSTSATGSPAPATSTSAAGPQTTAEVAVDDNTFTPARVTIAAGGTVTWTWGGRLPHSVASADFTSDTKTGSGRFAFTFARAGTFDYICGVHGTAMAGQVIVQ